jgi:hypothetical protein
MAGCGVVALALLSACAVAKDTPQGRLAPPGLCEQSPTAAPSPDCAAAKVQQYQQSNQTFNGRRILPDSLAARAKPVTARIQRSLEALTPLQRQQPDTVQSTLIAAGVLSEELVIYPSPDGVTFYGYEPFNTSPAVCAYGTVTTRSIVVNMAGNTNDGTCAPTSGGH